MIGNIQAINYFVNFFPYNSISFFREVFYLVDDFLILALDFHVESETENASDDAS